jgi:hypothetical protein
MKTILLTMATLMAISANAKTYNCSSESLLDVKTIKQEWRSGEVVFLTAAAKNVVIELNEETKSLGRFENADDVQLTDQNGDLSLTVVKNRHAMTVTTKSGADINFHHNDGETVLSVDCKLTK